MNVKTEADEVPSAVKALNPRSAPVPSRTKEQRERREERKEAERMTSEVLEEEVEERKERKNSLPPGGGSQRPRVRALQIRQRGRLYHKEACLWV